MLIKLQVKDLAFSYGSMPVLDNVYIEAAPSKLVSIVGPNGSGKSTLLRCIDRILKPQRGSILLDRRETMEMSRMEIAKKMGYVQQTYSRGFPTTVVDTVLMGRRPHMGWHTGEEDEEIVWEILKLLDIEELGMKFFNELSGGQQQKVLIGRALAQEADILLLDEPTSNLDIRRQLEVMDIIKDLVKKEEITAIVAIHDLNLASRYSDRIILMKRGKIVGAGDPVSVLTAENIASVYGVEAAVRTQSETPYIVPLRPIKIARGRSHLVTK
jgi:iron complex transport system ATP-binding protein